MTKRRKKVVNELENELSDLTAITQNTSVDVVSNVNETLIHTKDVVATTNTPSTEVEVLVTNVEKNDAVNEFVKELTKNLDETENNNTIENFVEPTYDTVHVKELTKNLDETENNTIENFVEPTYDTVHVKELIKNYTEVTEQKIDVVQEEYLTVSKETVYVQPVQQSKIENEPVSDKKSLRNLLDDFVKVHKFHNLVKRSSVDQLINRIKNLL